LLAGVLAGVLVRWREDRSVLLPSEGKAGCVVGRALVEDRELDLERKIQEQREHFEKERGGITAG